MKTKFAIFYLLSAILLLWSCSARAQRAFDTSKLYFATNGGSYTNYTWTSELRAYTNTANHGWMQTNLSVHRWEYYVGATLVATNSSATNVWTGTNGVGVYTSYWAGASSPAGNTPVISTNQASTADTNPPAQYLTPSVVGGGTNAPEGVYAAGKGSIYNQFDSTGTNVANQWIKTTTSGNTGWKTNILTGSAGSVAGAVTTNFSYLEIPELVDVRTNSFRITNSGIPAFDQVFSLSYSVGTNGGAAWNGLILTNTANQYIMFFGSYGSSFYGAFLSDNPNTNFMFTSAKFRAFLPPNVNVSVSGALTKGYSISNLSSCVWQDASQKPIYEMKALPFYSAVTNPSPVYGRFFGEFHGKASFSSVQSDNGSIQMPTTPDWNVNAAPVPEVWFWTYPRWEQCRWHKLGLHNQPVDLYEN